MSALLKTEIGYFLVVGTIGFLVDAGFVYVLTEFVGLEPIIARIPALAVALITTFVLNRFLTFKNGRETSIIRAFVKYLSANALSQGVNFAIFSLLVVFSPFLYENPVIALAIGSIAAMSLSFALSKLWVFKTPLK